MRSLANSLQIIAPIRGCVRGGRGTQDESNGPRTLDVIGDERWAISNENSHFYLKQSSHWMSLVAYCVQCARPMKEGAVNV